MSMMMNRSFQLGVGIHPVGVVTRLQTAGRRDLGSTSSKETKKCYGSLNCLNKYCGPSVQGGLYTEAEAVGVLS